MCIKHAPSAALDERNARERIKPEAIELPAKTTINYMLILTNCEFAVGYYHIPCKSSLFTGIVTSQA